MARRSTVLGAIMCAVVLVILVWSTHRRSSFFANCVVPEIDILYSDRDFNLISEYEFMRPSTSPQGDDSEKISVDDRDDSQRIPVYHHKVYYHKDDKAERMRAHYQDDAKQIPSSSGFLPDREYVPLWQPFLIYDLIGMWRVNDRRQLLEIGFKRRAQFCSQEESRSGQNHRDTSSENEVRTHQTAEADRSSHDAKIRQLKDLLIRARIYVTLPRIRSNAPFIKELSSMMKELRRAVGGRTKDAELPKDVHKKLRAMEETLAKGKQIQYDCSAVVRKLLAMIHSAQREIRVHRQLTTYLTQVTAKTVPKSLHCLPSRLIAEYFSKFSGEQQPSNEYTERTNDPNLYHYALFSENILATAVVVNSTIFNAKIPEKHVFHIVTDKWHYAAMKMWFIANPPGKGHVHIQNIDDFTWLNSSYSPVLKHLRSKSNGPKSKYRNPKYVSILNHLRFYLPEVLPKLDKVVFLDDDIVVQKDLTDLWNIDMKGKVNGAVETCSTEFHRFRRYLNFSNPLIAENFDPHACGWAFGTNVFDLAEWRKQKMTELYHYWQNKNADRQLGNLPPGLLTFYNQTVPLDRSWHVLGLGYNPSVDKETVERAAVIHYNGNFKPWLDLGFPEYRPYWLKYVNFDHIFLQDCKITP